MRVAFRVDASRQIGSGHVMRCLALARSLRDENHEVLFLCRSHEGHKGDEIVAAGHQVCWLGPASMNAQGIGDLAHGRWLGTSQIEDAAETLRLIGRGQFDWLVVDHYGIDHRWESNVKSHVSRLMVIDDLADRNHDCDLLLDQNFYLDSESRYDTLLPRRAARLIGPSYALLRDEFATARSRLPSRDGSVTRVLICLGGGDDHGHTSRILRAIQHECRELRVTVLSGKQSSPEEIEAACRQLPMVRLLTQSSDISALLLDADLAIGAGGSMTWERCCLGVPSIGLGVAVNQRRMLIDMTEAGFLLSHPDILSTSDDDLRATFHVALRSRSLLRGFATRSAALVDGKGTSRVRSSLLA